VDVYAIRSEGRVRAQVTILLEKLSSDFQLAVSVSDEKGVPKGVFSTTSASPRNLVPDSRLVAGTVQVDPNVDSYLTVTGQTTALAARYRLTIK
jgi:hypothetical protein